MADEIATRKSIGPRSLAALLPPVTRPAFRKRSPVSARILSDWQTLVGPGLAARISPRNFAAGTLTVACDGPTAMELQLLGARLVERINVQLGEACVARLRIVQAPVDAAPAPRPARRPPRPAAPIDGIEGELGERLARLQAAIAARQDG